MWTNCLIQDAHNLYKPILAICFGTQILNVWRGGTLVQDLTVMPVNHGAGGKVAIAHSAAVAPRFTARQLAYSRRSSTARTTFSAYP